MSLTTLRMDGIGGNFNKNVETTASDGDNTTEIRNEVKGRQTDIKNQLERKRKIDEVIL